MACLQQATKFPPFPRELPYTCNMNALDILFETSRFNLSRVEEHFINPCCFGEDLAFWLRTKFAEKDIGSAQPYQEDWGWELPVPHGGDAYYLCMSGNRDESATNKDDGEWRIIVQKRRSFWQRRTGKAKITADDPLLRLTEGILSGELTIQNVRRE
jgi:hypothetical protein